MKIETMLRAMLHAHDRRYGIYTRRMRQFNAFFNGIARRYIRLQQENARLRDDVAFWKLEAQRWDGDDE